MATFVTELWESIFTPGPTPSLLVATNVSFACLQVVLGLLLFFSFSIHFVILSALCSGLWWSINWFARELKEGQRRQAVQEAKARRDACPPGDDSDTEVEASSRGLRSTRSNKKQGGANTQEAGVVVKEPVEPVEPVGELKHRLEAAGPAASSSSHGGGGGTQSNVSTEDEWERVSESEKDK